MKTALITTTINVPTVLELYRQHGSDVMFFVAGDRKTPDEEVVKLLERLGPHAYYGIDYQHKLGYKCSTLIGENSIQRRNIALLEAVKWGAEIIVSTDDDNIPVDKHYFSNLTKHWTYVGHPSIYDKPFAGIKVSGINGWFDVGRLLSPNSSHRGFPIAHRNDLWRADPATGAKVGVAAGICLGDPDISASTRIERSPEVHGVSELLQSGIVVDPGTHTVFNSQNTAFIRELAPAFFMLPGVGRYDDIYASLIMQRVMRERGLHVHFGKPFVWQQRNQHNLVKDLRGEIDGMEDIERFAQRLADSALPKNATIIQQLRYLWTDCVPFVNGTAIDREAAFAFLDDIERVL